jgi:hypothetical protein
VAAGEAVVAPAVQTGLLRDSRTAIVRLAGNIRGDAMQLPRKAAAEAVIRCAGRFPFFVEAYDRQGVEIDLLQVSEPEVEARVDGGLEAAGRHLLEDLEQALGD